jgi:hypothetical protein
MTTAYYTSTHLVQDGPVVPLVPELARGGVRGLGGRQADQRVDRVLIGNAVTPDPVWFGDKRYDKR